MTKPLFRMATVAAFAAMTVLPATASITTKAENLENPRGWSAVSGTDAATLRDRAAALPTGDAASAQQPFCDQNAEIERTLRHDFEEEHISDVAANTALWGSDVMGTWTVVVERQDATSCIIASGIGYDDATNPQVFYTKAGLHS